MAGDGREEDAIKSALKSARFKVVNEFWRASADGDGASRPSRGGPTIDVGPDCPAAV